MENWRPVKLPARQAPRWPHSRAGSAPRPSTRRGEHRDLVVPEIPGDTEPVQHEHQRGRLEAADETSNTRPGAVSILRVSIIGFFRYCRLSRARRHHLSPRRSTAPIRSHRPPADRAQGTARPVAGACKLAAGLWERSGGWLTREPQSQKDVNQRCVRIPIKATACEPINRPDTYQRLPIAPSHLRRAAGPYIRGRRGVPTAKAERLLLASGRGPLLPAIRPPTFGPGYMNAVNET